MSAMMGRAVFTAFLAVLLGCGLPRGALAADYVLGSLQIGNPWARATPKGANVAAGYLKLTNKGTTADRFIGGSSSVAERFEIHTMVMEQGVAKMRPVAGGLEIKPGDTVELKPGSLHVMFVGLKQPLAKGEKVKATLQFEKAGSIEVEYTVEAIGAAMPVDQQHQH
ncbi:MAG: copper chaperone PCu(A)C [Xanthobacteraceae bacterium]